MDYAEHLREYVEVSSVSEQWISLTECPWCGKSDKHRSHCFVSVKFGSYHCFRCGAKGNWEMLLAEISGISVREAKRITGKDKLPDLKVIKEKEFPKPLDLPPHSRMTGRAESYLASRSLSIDTIDLFELYYCGYGKYARRIIVPVIKGGIRYAFQGRSIDGTEPRYLAPSYPLNFFVFNIDNISASHILLAEGPFDVMALHQMGYPAVCCFGKMVSKHQIRQLEEKGVKKLTIIYDSDAFESSLDKWKDLNRHFFEVRIAMLEGGDPAELLQEEIKEAILTSAKTAEEAKMSKFRRRLDGAR